MNDLFNDLSVEPDIFHYFGKIRNASDAVTNTTYTTQYRTVCNCMFICAAQQRSTDSKKISRRCIFNQIHRALSKDYYGFLCDRNPTRPQEKRKITRTHTHKRKQYSANNFACIHAAFPGRCTVNLRI